MNQTEEEKPVPPGEDPQRHPGDGEEADDDTPREGESHEDPAEGGEEAPTG